MGFFKLKNSSFLCVYAKFETNTCNLYYAYTEPYQQQCGSHVWNWLGIFSSSTLTLATSWKHCLPSLQDNATITKIITTTAIAAQKTPSSYQTMHMTLITKVQWTRANLLGIEEEYTDTHMQMKSAYSLWIENFAI